jgi:hypothetical protein
MAGILERGMRVDPKGTVRGYPAMLIRQTLRRLRGDCEWGVEALENAAKLKPGAGRAFAKALQAEGLIEVSRHGGWTVTQSGETMGGHGGEAGDAANGGKSPGGVPGAGRAGQRRSILPCSGGPGGPVRQHVKTRGRATERRRPGGSTGCEGARF